LLVIYTDRKKNQTIENVPYVASLGNSLNGIASTFEWLDQER